MRSHQLMLGAHAWLCSPARRGQRAAAPSALPTRGFAPGYPDLIHPYAERLMCMPTGRSEPAAADQAGGTPEACADGLIVRQASRAGGLGACYAPNGEREGQSPLACTLQSISQWGSARGGATLSSAPSFSRYSSICSPLVSRRFFSSPIVVNPHLYTCRWLPAML